MLCEQNEKKKKIREGKRKNMREKIGEIETDGEGRERKRRRKMKKMNDKLRGLRKK